MKHIVDKCRALAGGERWSFIDRVIKEGLSDAAASFRIESKGLKDSDSRMAFFESSTNMMCEMTEIADAPALRRSQHVDQCVRSIAELTDRMADILGEAAGRKLVDDPFDQGFVGSGVFLNESEGLNQYRQFFKGHVDKHHKAKGSLKDLSHPERKQFFKDVGNAWQEHKKKTAASTKPADKHDTESKVKKIHTEQEAYVREKLQAGDVGPAVKFVSEAVAACDAQTLLEFMEMNVKDGKVNIVSKVGDLVAVDRQSAFVPDYGKVAGRLTNLMGRLTDPKDKAELQECIEALTEKKK